MQTHWFVTKAKSKKVQCNDSMEPLCERIPDLHRRTNVLYQFSISKFLIFPQTHIPDLSLLFRQWMDDILTG